MIEDRDIPHREAFEKFKVAHVRFLAESRTDEVGPAARAWLSELRDNRDAEIAERRDAREERTLAISENANRISSSASRISKRANTLAIIAAVAAIIAAIATVIIAIKTP